MTDKYIPPAPKHYTPEIVWGCAAAAHRLNEGYHKDPVHEWKDDKTMVLVKDSNKSIVRGWLREENYAAVTEADIEKGKEYRRHFAGYTLAAIRGPLNDFQQQALKIANIDEFTGRHLLEFSIVACLPAVAERDSSRSSLKKEVFASTQLAGQEGDTIVGDLTVVSSKYMANYSKYRIAGRMGESFVDFWTNLDLAADQVVRIKAKIKKHRDDKTTQLNYVKKA